MQTAMVVRPATCTPAIGSCTFSCISRRTVAIRFHQNDVIIWYSTYVTVVLEYCFTLRST